MYRKTIIWVFEHPNTSSFETGVHQLLCEQSKMTPIDFAKPIIWSFVGEPCLSLVLQRSIATLWNTHRPTKGARYFDISKLIEPRQRGGDVRVVVMGTLKSKRCTKAKSAFDIYVKWQDFGPWPKGHDRNATYTAECTERRIWIFKSVSMGSGPAKARETVASYPVNCFEDLETALHLFEQHMSPILQGLFEHQGLDQWQKDRGGYRCKHWVAGSPGESERVPVDVRAGPMPESFVAVGLNAYTMELPSSGGSALAN